jgi:signal transduction histidine kinase
MSSRRPDDQMVPAKLDVIDALAAERRRIARELHDRVGHGMGLALQNLELYHHYAQRDPERGRAKLAATATVLRDCARAVRQLSSELRRSVDGDGIGPALEAYLRGAAPPTLRTSLAVVGDTTALPPEVSEELYLILREATWNAVRHAGAAELRLVLAVTDAWVTASATDDGRGFDPGAVHGRGGGLASMAERAHLLRGSLDVTSASGRGTTVTLRIPLAQPRAAAA